MPDGRSMWFHGPLSFLPLFSDLLSLAAVDNDGCDPQAPDPFS
jgi:hypothetical protein